MAASTMYLAESFKRGTSLADLLLGNWQTNDDGHSYYSLPSTGGRFGGQCIKIATSGNAGSNLLWSKAFDEGNLSTVCVHFPWYVEAAAATLASSIVVLADGSSGQITLTQETSGVLKIRRGSSTGTVLGTSTWVPTLNTWYCMELKIVFHGSTGTIELRADGVAVIGPTTGLNTIQTANAYCNKVMIGDDYANNNTKSITWRMEHLTVLDDFAGDKRFYTSLPAAASSTAWTPNASTNLSRVNEANQDGDTTYNSSNTPGDIDLFSISATPGGTTGILGVQVSMWAKKDNAGARQLGTRISSSGSTADGTARSVSTSYVEYLDRFMTDPNTSAAWTKSGVDAVLIGYKDVA